MPELLALHGTAGTPPEFNVEGLFREGRLVDVARIPDLFVEQESKTGSVSSYWAPHHARLGLAEPVSHEESIWPWLRAATLNFTVNPIAERREVAGVQSRRVEGLWKYLDVCKQEDLISSAVSKAVWRTWLKLNARLHNRLEVPDACPGSEGEILLTWDRAGHHFELEVADDLTAAFFYLNRDQKTSWELQTRPDEPIGEAVARVLQLFQVQVSVS